MVRRGFLVATSLFWSLGSSDHAAAWNETIALSRSESGATLLTLWGVLPNCSRPDSTSATVASNAVSVATITVDTACWPEAVAPNPSPYSIVVDLGMLQDGTYALAWAFARSNGYDAMAATFTIPLPPPQNYQGQWWAPNGAEREWGLHLAHQGDTIVASWVAYGGTGSAFWMVMTAQKSASNAYSGTVYSTVGPPVNADPFDPVRVLTGSFGTGTLTFDDGKSGTFTVVFPGPFGTPAYRETKLITRQSFGPLPKCTFRAQPNLAPGSNYTDLWWAAPSGSESGWGIGLTHQGDTLVAAWFTHDLDGSSMWLVATARRTAAGIYSGTLFRTSGPAFGTIPLDPARVAAIPVGSMTLTFADGNHATFAYSASTAAGTTSQTKPIAREVFAAPGTVCL